MHEIIGGLLTPPLLSCQVGQLREELTRLEMEHRKKEERNDKLREQNEEEVCTAIIIVYITSAYMVFHAEGLAGIELHYAA